MEARVTVFLVRLRTKRGADPGAAFRSLRGLLKQLLRRTALRCVELAREDEEAAK
jgi:hypothetical protein